MPAYGGGGIHVWTTCLMLFQGLLLAGYLYAHFAAPRIGRWHLAVAALALFFLPIGFNGDAIPTHLLTLEAVELYLRKLRPDGLLICHISNRFYDLRPVLKATGAALGLQGTFRLPEPARELAPLEFASSYQVLSRDAPRIRELVARGWTPIGSGDALPRLRPWSDDFVNVLAPLWQRLMREEWRDL